MSLRGPGATGSAGHRSTQDGTLSLAVRIRPAFRLSCIAESSAFPFPRRRTTRASCFGTHSAYASDRSRLARHRRSRADLPTAVSADSYIPRGGSAHRRCDSQSSRKSRQVVDQLVRFAADVAISPASEDSAQLVPPQVTVLLVERDPHVTALAIHFLGAAGYVVEVAADGQDALGKVLLRIPDLVITEILVPKLDGLAICRQLKT